MAQKIFSAVLCVISIATMVGCSESATPPVTYTPTQLKYQLIGEFGEPFYCDPYLYPIARQSQEEQDAIAQFPAIMSDQEEFTEILKHLGLTETSNYITSEKVLIFQEYNKLNNAITLTAADDIYDFSLRVGENQGEFIQGTITVGGTIKVTNRQASINTCPICLATGTLIDTSDGPVPVEQLRVGMIIWSINDVGQRVIETILQTSSTQVPSTFRLLKIVLEDGRTITASPGHPAADGHTLGNLAVGDMLDGSKIVSSELVTYSDCATYDILPSGPTGQYWANGVLLGSTLGR